LDNLMDAKAKLQTKTAFKPPVAKAKRKVINENGDVVFVDVDLENDLLDDDNESLYEEVIDENGNVKMVKVDEQKMYDIKKYKES